MHISRSTWQALGLSVAGGYAILGTFSTFFPATSAKTLFNLGNGQALWPYSSPAGGKLVSPTETDRAIKILVPLLGVRNFSIAAAIFALQQQDRYVESGTVILSGVLLCAADVVVAWNQRGATLGMVLLLGALQWCSVGWGLRNWY